MPPAAPLHATARPVSGSPWAKARQKGARAPRWYGLAPQYSPVPYGRAWTDSRLEQVQHFKEMVFKAVNAIATIVADQTPVLSITPSEPEMSERARKGLAPVMPHEELAPAPGDHPLNGLLIDANGYDTFGDVLQETVLYLELTGSAYWWIPPNGLGLPAEIWVIPSHWVWPSPGKDKLVDFFQVRPIPGSGNNYEIPADEVIHFRKPSPLSKLDGYSPLTAGALSIDCYESIQRSKFHSFKNSANPSIAIECDDNVTDPSPEQVDRIEKRFMDRYSGENRVGKPMILPPGFKAHAYSHSPKEMDYLASCAHSGDDILELWAVPPIILGRAQDMTYGSVGAAQLGFYTFAVNPRLGFLARTATQQLAWKFDRRLKLWFPECTPNDPEHREKEIETDLRNGVRSINEVRRVRGLAPFQYGGDNAIIAAIGVELPYGTGVPSVRAEPLTEPEPATYGLAGDE